MTSMNCAAAGDARRGRPARHWVVPALVCALAAASTCLAGDSDAKRTYAYASNGVLDNIGASGVKWKLVIDESNLGGKELEAAEVTLPAGTATASHGHGAIEVLYVLSGTYEHEVNGKRYRLTPGMVGIVRPGDKVRHLATKDGDTKLLVIWTPAGEAKRLQQAEGTRPPPVPEVQK
jgi:quercetin dioxygenase-like cupin family protein